MKKQNSVILFFLLACIVVAACAPVTDFEANASSDVKTDVRSAFDAYVAAINAGDLQKATTYYDNDDDFHWIDQGKLQYASAEAAKESLLNSSPSDSSTQFAYDGVYIADLSANAALVSVRYTYAVSFESDATGYGWEGWMTFAMVKREDGWKIAGGQAGPAAEEQP